MSIFRVILSIYLSGMVVASTSSNDISADLLDTVRNTNKKLLSILKPVPNDCLNSKTQASCELVEKHGLDHIENGKLSAFWGYEFIGVDLMQKLLKDMNLTKIKIATSEKVNLSELPIERLGHNLRLEVEGIYEFSGGNHGTKVNNIILGDYPVGISHSAQLSSTEVFQKTNDDEYLLSTNSFINEGIKIFQASESIYDNNINYLKKIIDAGVITIRSAGNDHPMLGVAQSSPSLSIIVGQLSPLGVPASDSSEGESVTILAPGRNYSYANEEHTVFGGTSGAQPVVTGCLANIVSLLPGLSQKEATNLLVKTSIPTLNSKDKVKKNGAGTINCYKLTRVALALKSQWPQSRTLIDLERTYDFSKESQEILSKADQVIAQSDMCSQRQALDLLRKAFLLNPNNKNLILKIAKIYQAAGFELNSQLYKSLLGIDLKSAIKINREYINSTYFSGDLLRFSVDHLNPHRDILHDALGSSDDNTVIFASLYSKDIVDSTKIEANLVGLVFNEKIDGYNYSLFEKSFFINNQFSAKALLNACSEKTREWESQEYNSALISCLSFLKHDDKEAILFLKKQFLRESPKFMEYFERYLQDYRNFDDKELIILTTLIQDESISDEIKMIIKAILTGQEL